MYHHRSQRPITATTQMHNNIQTNRTLIPQPSPILWGKHCGSDDRDCQTQPRRAIVPRKVATPLTSAVRQGPTSRRCGHARHRPTPTPRRDAHTTHTEPGPSCCVPFGDPHVHNVTQSDETRQECSHSSAHTMGTNPPYGEDTPDRRQVQRKGTRGCMNNGFCDNTDPCPLASPRVALVGVCLLRHPDNGNTR